MTTPENRLNSPENSKTIKDAAYTARDIGRRLSGPAPVTVEVLGVACGAANAVARQLNKLCGRIIDRTGRGAEIAKLKAELASETRRLDFVLKNDAFLTIAMLDRPIRRFELSTQNEDEEYINLSGKHKSFETPRAAIDAAMKISEGGVA